VLLCVRRALIALTKRIPDCPPRLGQIARGVSTLIEIPDKIPSCLQKPQFCNVNDGTIMQMAGNEALHFLQAKMRTITLYLVATFELLRCLSRPLPTPTASWRPKSDASTKWRPGVPRGRQWVPP
jgi:hypothetical protein